MHPLSEFTPYIPSQHTLTGESVVLLWSHTSGYHFSQLGFADLSTTKIIAVKENLN